MRILLYSVIASDQKLEKEGEDYPVVQSSVGPGFLVAKPPWIETHIVSLTEDHTHCGELCWGALPLCEPCKIRILTNFGGWEVF